MEILGEVLGDGLKRILSSFPGMAFNMSIHRNVHTDRLGLFSG